ncbi:MAG: diacylglycerol kinase family lipid kinase [Bacteroidia bacterium]|nr:diacylglycerol kinase family lipid kinase [Bacteroidia bacterium]
MSSQKVSAAIIINPISGGRDKKAALEIIKNGFPKDISYELIFWERPEQKDEIIKRVRENNYEIVVAAGGDGTINQVAQAVIGTNSRLAIIPLGSGNGLARHLGIPLDTRAAVELIGSGREIKIDGSTVNGTHFFCTSGIGFDALIGKLFAESKTRGFFTYLKLIVYNFIRYKPEQYCLIVDGTAIKTTAFLITFANASQYGNNAFIAPQADISDGYIDIVILKPFRFWQAPFIALKMFKRTLHLSGYVDVYKGKNISVSRSSAGPVHFDGEPAEMGTTLDYKIMQDLIKVIVS